MALGTAWCGRRPVKPENQWGSIPQRAVKGADDRSSGTLVGIEAARCKAAGLASFGNVNTNKPLRVNAGRFSECLSVKLSMGVFNTGVEHAKRFATSPCVKGELRRLVYAVRRAGLINPRARFNSWVVYVSLVFVVEVADTPACGAGACKSV